MTAIDSSDAPLPEWTRDGYLLLDSRQETFDRVEEAFNPAVITEETRRVNAELEEMTANLPPADKVPPFIMRKVQRRGKGMVPVFGPLEEGRWLEFKGASGREGALRVMEPEGTARGVFMHMHGGGWTLGAPDEFDARNLELSQRAGIVVASVRYRLAPEHPWPAPLEDGLDAYAWLVERAKDEFGTDRIAVGGDSAGAHLSAATLLRAREEGLPGAVAAVLTGGPFDLRKTPSMVNWGERKLVVSTFLADWFVDNLVPDGVSDDPLLSPVLSDLTGMPPALFSVGTEDPLVDDTRIMAAHWVKAGSWARLALFPGGAHAFNFQDIAIARAYRELRIRFLSEMFGSG